MKLINRNEPHLGRDEDQVWEELRKDTKHGKNSKQNKLKAEFLTKNSNLKNVFPMKSHKDVVSVQKSHRKPEPNTFHR